MSGWIKLDHDLWDRPNVVTLASRLRNAGVTRRGDVIGALFRVWSLADQFTSDGRLPGYTAEIIDDMVEIEGFTAALEEIGWVKVEPEAVTVLEFEKHHGDGKKRAQNAKRQARLRNARVTPEARQPRYQTETKTETKTKTKTKKKGESPPTPSSRDSAEVPPELATPAFLDALAEWDAHLAAKGKSCSPTSRRAMIDQLAEMGPSRSVAAIRYSLSRGTWVSIVEPPAASQNGNSSGLTRSNARTVDGAARYIASKGGTE